VIWLATLLRSGVRHGIIVDAYSASTAESGSAVEGAVCTGWWVIPVAISRLRRVVCLVTLGPIQRLYSVRTSRVGWRRGGGGAGTRRRPSVTGKLATSPQQKFVGLRSVIWADLVMEGVKAVDKASERWSRQLNIVYSWFPCSSPYIYTKKMALCSPGNKCANPEKTVYSTLWLLKVYAQSIYILLHKASVKSYRHFWRQNLDPYFIIGCTSAAHTYKNSLHGCDVINGSNSNWIQAINNKRLWGIVISSSPFIDGCRASLEAEARHPCFHDLDEFTALIFDIRAC
jgi:hypothetical protein